MQFQVITACSSKDFVSEAIGWYKTQIVIIPVVPLKCAFKCHVFIGLSSRNCVSEAILRYKAESRHLSFNFSEMCSFK